MFTGGELVRIIAVVDHDLAKRTHGVIASVDAHQEADVDKGVMVELKNLRVDEGFRRRGIARALVEAVKEYAREVCNERMTTVHLAIELDNVGAIKLYKSQGFQQDPIEERRLLWKT
jgi:ribosomal protein S18 acetylase RimI-like enzyme